MELQTIDKATLSTLPAEVFPGRIELVQTEAAAIKALSFLTDQSLVGFDTETRPQMVFILKHQSILSIFPRLTNKFCNRRTNDTLPT